MVLSTYLPSVTRAYYSSSQHDMGVLLSEKYKGERVSKVFNAHAVLPAQKFSWLGRILRQIPVALEGVFWGGLFLGGIFDVVKNCCLLAKSDEKNLPIAEGSSLQDFKIKRLWLNSASNFFSTVLSGVYFLEWMKSVKWLGNSLLSGFLRPIGLSASLIASAIKIFRLSLDLIRVKMEMRNCESSSRECQCLGEHKRLILLEVAFAVNTIAWSVLSLVDLFLHVPVFFSLKCATFLLGGPLLVALFVYKRVVEKEHLKIPPLVCCSEFS